MSDPLLLTVACLVGCAAWSTAARRGLAGLRRRPAAAVLALLLGPHVTRVGVRLASGETSTASVALAAVVSALAFAALSALAARRAEARRLAWAATVLGGVDLVAAFADAFAGGAALVASPVQFALSGVYLPALVVSEALLVRTLLRPEPLTARRVEFTEDSRAAISSFTAERHSRSLGGGRPHTTPRPTRPHAPWT